MRRSGVTDCHSQCARWLHNDIDNKRVGSPPPPKKLAEFAARRRQKIGIIFHRDMRVGKIPLRLPVWNFAACGKIMRAAGGKPLTRKIKNFSGKLKKGCPEGQPFYDLRNYSSMSITTPEPTVRPPSRIAKRRPFSIAMGVISSTFMSTLSPGMHISVPSGRVMTPVTSVVRK